MARRLSLRSIPQVERLLQEPVARNILETDEVPREVLVEAVRSTLRDVRRRILSGEIVPLDTETLVAQSLALARRVSAPKLIRVVNATGVVLHTNLGRAPLAPEAVAAMMRVAGYCNLEYELSTGRRGDRHTALGDILRELTGAEAALVVNNNAAAVLLALAALARGREVVVSRGELVEIGGSFRIPEVLAQSGAVLREVGTTNKTHAVDYEAAIGPDTALLLKVHTSNYRVLGFTAAVPLSELVRMATGRGIRVVEDLGSGCFVDLSSHGLEKEPTVAEAVASGADLVTFSGDKLLGGPQAGILVGRRDAVEACAAHPLMRALRPDKVTLAALEATLALYRDPVSCFSRVPALARVVGDAKVVRGRAEVLAQQVRGALGNRGEVIVRQGMSEVGGGSLPLQKLETWVVEVRRGRGGISRLEAFLREHAPPVICRIQEDALVFDPRTLADGEDAVVAEAVRSAFEREERA